MPQRKFPIATGEIYHVFNRGIDKRPTFIDKREYQRAILTINFYRYLKTPVKLSRLLTLRDDESVVILQSLQKTDVLVEMIAFCLMPNHFHFLLSQKVDNGISKFISQFQNSYTRYFNTKNERIGPLFLDQFKAVRIESDEQLLHVSRYVHLNPYSSFVVKHIEDLDKYPWSSLKEYLGYQEGFSSKNIVFQYFKNDKDYKKFVYDQADYQRTLERIKHLAID